MKKNSNSDIEGPTHKGSDEGQNSVSPGAVVDLEMQANGQQVVDLTPQQLAEEQSTQSNGKSNTNGINIIKEKNGMTTMKVATTQDKSGDDNSSSNHSSDCSSNSSLRRFADNSTHRVTTFILLLGLAVSGGFLGLGISAAFKTQEEAFDRNAVDLVNKISTAWFEYVNSAGMIHGRCRGRDFSRADFRDFYESLLGGGLSFQAAQFDPNVTHDERAEFEEEARSYYAEFYPHFEYRGFIGFEYENSTSLEPRSEQDFYFPIHYMEPVIGNERACGLDYHASGSRKRTVLYCMDNGLPALTDRLTLVQETETAAYGVVLMHPGYELSNSTERWPKDLASIVIRIPDLLRRATENQGSPSEVYLYDRSDSSGKPIFLGAVRIKPSTTTGDYAAELEFLGERDLGELEGEAHLYRAIDVDAANKIWTVAVVATDGTFQAEYVFVLVGGIIIFLATIGLAWWVHQNTKRVAKMNRLKAESEAEKAALILESARKSAHAERELNDFIAHEVGFAVLYYVGISGAAFSVFLDSLAVRLLKGFAYTSFLFAFLHYTIRFETRSLPP